MSTTSPWRGSYARTWRPGTSGEPRDDNSSAFGWTDMGNVSQVVPSIHTSVSIASPGESEHTPAFARHAVSERGLTQTIRAATALACTGIDLLASPDTLAAVKQEFEGASPVP